MATKSSNERVVLTISKSLLSNFRARAERTGQSLSAVISLALLEYMEQKDALSSMEKMVSIYEANAEIITPGGNSERS